jgi:hypothetical protein
MRRLEMAKKPQGDDDDTSSIGHSRDTEPEVTRTPRVDPSRIGGVGHSTLGRQYKLITADAVIDGVRYSQHIEGGHYGLFTFSPERVEELKAQGIQLVPV